jgi:hypothetical protein
MHSFEACEQSLRPAERGMWAMVTDTVARQAIEEMLQLCSMQIDPQSIKQFDQMENGNDNRL